MWVCAVQLKPSWGGGGLYCCCAGLWEGRACAPLVLRVGTRTAHAVAYPWACDAAPGHKYRAMAGQDPLGHGAPYPWGPAGRSPSTAPDDARQQRRRPCIDAHEPPRNSWFTAAWSRAPSFLLSWQLTCWGQGLLWEGLVEGLGLRGTMSYQPATYPLLCYLCFVAPPPDGPSDSHAERVVGISLRQAEWSTPSPSTGRH